MADAAPLGRGQQVVHRGLEEGRGGFVEGRRVGQVDDDIGSRHRLVQPLAGDDVDSGGLRVRHRLVPGGVQVLDDLRSDQPGTADDCELHDMPFVGITSEIRHMDTHASGASTKLGHILSEKIRGHKLSE
ncbi:hypothetical protein SSPO_068590 [Streptomyces antimycoticus]|uniref:Uncharacterized protein n=1 Tax=Streptomyces antimycoticus TaxID=68175 RepID=A0A499V3L3_9ACTN|nr:hypothetical protein SSPO_068590 [Streptomyces antimycoticus]